MNGYASRVVVLKRRHNHEKERQIKNEMKLSNVGRTFLGSMKWCRCENNFCLRFIGHYPHMKIKSSSTRVKWAKCCVESTSVSCWHYVFPLSWTYHSIFSSETTFIRIFSGRPANPRRTTPKNISFSLSWSCIYSLL